MSKGLEALHRIANAKNHFKYDTLELVDKDFQIVQQALLRLEAIDNANPSEALKYVNGKIADLEDDLQHYTMVEKDKCKEFFIREDLKQFTTIKQALLKSQEQEKVLEILVKKRVDLPYLRCCFEDNQSVERYNEYIRSKTMDYDHEEELTEEEFDLLKRYCDEQDN